jgi:hypothetical protein
VNNFSRRSPISKKVENMRAQIRCATPHSCLHTSFHQIILTSASYHYHHNYCSRRTWKVSSGCIYIFFCSPRHHYGSRIHLTVQDLEREDVHLSLWIASRSLQDFNRETFPSLLDTLGGKALEDERKQMIRAHVQLINYAMKHEYVYPCWKTVRSML